MMNMKICGLLVFMTIAVHYTAAEFGFRQSPIDVVTKNLAVALLPSLQWGDGYFQLADTMDVACDGHSVIVSTNQQNVPTLSGGPLGSAVYKFRSLHFHWGSRNDVGSEHTIDGRSYSMEMHIVHTKGNLTMEEAQRLPDGISVIAYMVHVASDPHEIEYNRNVEAFRILAYTMDKLKVVNEKVKMEEKFPLRNLVAPFSCDYATYAGSLTTTPYSEAVIWILSPYELVISQVEMNSFRSLTTRHLMEDHENYRSTQPLNSRNVYYDISQSDDNLNDIKKKYYNDKFAKPNENNIFKKALFGDYRYQYSRSLYSKQPQLYLNDNTAYYFDTKISFFGEENQYYYTVVVVNYQNKRYSIYYKKNQELTYGFNIMGLIGLGHVPIDKRQDTITELLSDLNHVFLIYNMNLDYMRNLTDKYDLFRIQNTINNFCTPYLGVNLPAKKDNITP